MTTLTRLQRINLSPNRLTRLPPEIGNVYCLEHLSVKHNLLERLPSEMSRLERLRQVDTEGNPLTMG